MYSQSLYAASGLILRVYACFALLHGAAESWALGPVSTYSPNIYTDEISSLYRRYEGHLRPMNFIAIWRFHLQLPLNRCEL